MVPQWRAVNFISDRGFDDFAPRAPAQKLKALAAGDQTRATADQLKARRSRRETWRTWEEALEGRWKDREGRWKVLPAGGTERPAANITRNTVIASWYFAQNFQQSTSASGNLLIVGFASKGLQANTPFSLPRPLSIYFPGNSHASLYLTMFAIPVGNLTRTRRLSET